MKRTNVIARFYSRDFITIGNEYEIEVLKLIHKKEFEIDKATISEIEKILEDKAQELLSKSDTNIDFIELQASLDSTITTIGLSKYRSVSEPIKFLAPKPTKLKKLGLVTIRSIRLKENEVLEQPIFIDPGLTPSWEISDITWIEDVDLNNIYVYEGIIKALNPEKQNKALIMITEDGETLVIPSTTHVIAKPKKPKRRRTKKRKRKKRKRRKRKKRKT